MNITYRWAFGIRLAGGLAALFALVSPLKADFTYDHVVVVIWENHSYDQVLDKGNTYINGTLRAEGADLTSYGLQHPSQPNYYWLFSGSNQGIVIDTHPAVPFSAESNLYTTLIAAGKTFGGFVDAYPGADQLYQDSNNYAVRHVPWLGFTNIPQGITKSFTAFPKTEAGFEKLPTVSFVIPGLNHDMHDYDNSGHEVGNVAQSKLAMKHADAWMKANIDPYYQWAKKHNSLLIVTTDEDSTADWVTPPLTSANNLGLTSKSLPPNPNGPSGPNRITTLFAGAGIKAGAYAEGAGITNVNVLRTIESFYGLPPSGEQSPLAAAAGLGDGPVNDIYVTPILPISPQLGPYKERTAAAEKQWRYYYDFKQWIYQKDNDPWTYWSNLGDWAYLDPKSRPGAVHFYLYGTRTWASTSNTQYPQVYYEDLNMWIKIRPAPPLPNRFAPPPFADEF